MITKEIAVNAQYGDEFHHVSIKNHDGTPARCRVTGRCKTWKTRPAEFRLPVKYGMYESFYLTHKNMEEWIAGYGS